jgi:hypothetical protein
VSAGRGAAAAGLLEVEEEQKNAEIFFPRMSKHFVTCWKKKKMLEGAKNVVTFRNNVRRSQKSVD